MAYKDLVQQLYVGFYGRTADKEGLDYWTAELEEADGDFNGIKADFAGSQEYQVPMDGDDVDYEALVNMFYDNLFGREAEEEGLAFYVAGLESGDFSTDDLGKRIIDGATDDDAKDATVMANRAAFANYVSEQSAGYEFTDEQASEINVLLYSIDEDADVDGVIADFDAWLGQIDPPAPPQPGEGDAFWLTEARDMGWAAGDDFYGTADGDTYYGDVLQNALGQQVNSLGTGDRLDGNGGQNTLMAQVTEGAYVGDTNMPIQARTKNIQDIKLEAMNADMDNANSDVFVNAKHMWGVEELWSWESNGNLIVKDLTTLRSDGDHDNARNTSEMTVGMGYTNNSNTNWDASDFHVYFDQDFLLSGQESESRAIYYLLDQDSDLEGGEPLAIINVDGIRFSVDGGDEIELSSPAAMEAENHDGFVAALQEGLAQLKADGLVPEDTTLTVSSTMFDTTFLDDGSISSDIPAIVLETNTSSTFEPIGFAQAKDAIGEYNVYGRLGSESGVEAQPLSVQVAFEKAGRGGDGGELIIGSMDKYNKGIDVFNVTVYGDDDLPSSLSDLDSTGGALSHIYITSDNGDADSYADLTIGNGNSTDTTLNDGMTLVQSNGFMGDLSLGTDSARVLDLATLNTTDMSGSTTFWGDIASNGLYRVNTGAGDDTIDINLDVSAVNTDGNGLMIQSGAGADGIAINADPDFNVSQLTMFELKNMAIVAGGGDDDIEINGNFRFNIDAGDGSDFVYIKSHDPLGVWNVSNPTGPSTFADRVLYKAELTVTFAGFESTVDVRTDAGGKFIADQITINDAIKAAIDESPELSRLLEYTDGTAGQQLIIESLVDGANELSIDLYQPVLVAASATPGTGEVSLASGETDSLLEGIIATDATQNSATNPMTYVNGNQGSLDAAGNVGAYNDFLAPSVGTSADATGPANVNFSVINMGSGANNLVVLDSNDASANILHFNQTFGKVSVVNFFDDAALTQVGNHALDFTEYLDNQTSATQSTLSRADVPVTLNPATASANSVNLLSFTGTATETFSGLTAGNLVTALNGDGTATDNYANITNSTLDAVATTTNLVGNVQNHIVMVENAANLGEYKVFHLTSTIDATTGTTDGEFDTGGTLLGTLDFGNSINFNLVGSEGWAVDYYNMMAAADGGDVIVPPVDPPVDPDDHVFDGETAITDLGSYEAGDGDYLFTFDIAGSTKFANINEFNAGDAVQFETGNEEVTFISATDTDIEMAFGEIGGIDGSWFVTFTGLDAALVDEVAAEATIADQLEVLGTNWDLANNDWLQIA